MKLSTLYNGLVTSCVLLAGGMVVVAADQADDAILTTDSFEKGTDAPEGWEQGADVSGVKYIYDHEAGFDGKSSLSLQKSENRFFPIAQWSRTFNYSGDRTSLKVAAKVKAIKAAKAIFDVQFLDEHDQWIKHEWVSYIGQKKQGDAVATHDWKTYEGKIEIPKGTKRICIALQIYGPGKVWFDELDARYVDGTTATKPSQK